MKITTATLIATLALGSAVVFAQNSNLKPGTEVTTSGNATVTVTTVMKPMSKEESQEFHINRAASFSSQSKSVMGARELQTMPLQQRNVLDAIDAGR